MVQDRPRDCRGPLEHCTCLNMSPNNIETTAPAAAAVVVFVAVDVAVVSVVVFSALFVVLFVVVFVVAWWEFEKLLLS